MSGINKVILIGNLGNDPETKVLPNGNSVTNVSIATSEKWKDKQTGEQKEQTEWHRVVFFNRLAVIVAQYLSKGSKVYIEGKLKTSKYQAQDDTDRYSTEIVANSMQMLDTIAQSSPPAPSPSGPANQRPEPEFQGRRNPVPLSDDAPF